MTLVVKTTWRMEAMALDIPEWPEHPNRLPFSGVLTRVGIASDCAPSGAAGHRVLLPRSVAERALPSLLGMAVDYTPNLRGHDARRKIGVITRADIVDDRLEVSGHLFGKDFPEVVREMRTRAGQLGMSYEVTDVRVTDLAEEIWRLEHVVFTGAAILERSAAAYHGTSLAAAAAAKTFLHFRKAPPHIHSEFQGDPMNEKLARSMEALAASTQATHAELVNLRTALDDLRASQNTLQLAVERTLSAQANPSAIETRVDELARASEELRRQNETMRAQAEAISAQHARKTLPAHVLTLLAKSGVGTDSIGANGHVEPSVLDRALDGLPVEQRIAVKSQLARAGVIE